MLELIIGVTRANISVSSGEWEAEKSIWKRGRKWSSSSLEQNGSQLKRQESNGRREAFRLAEREKLWRPRKS
jgi:hypothetical protein